MNIDELRDRLLTEPFNQELRLEFAQNLFASEDWEESLTQFRLVAQQAPDLASGHMGEAWCLAKLDEMDAARESYDAAKSCSDFCDDMELAEFIGDQKQPALRVVEGPWGAREEQADITAIQSVRKTRFVDVVGMEDLKKTLRLKIIEPFKNPGIFERFKKSTGGGVLLYGPPGCGKTMIAAAVATECDAKFIPIGISDVLDIYHGGSERNLSSIFDTARAHAPAVLFFDELDTLAYSRSKANSDYTRSLVNEFLNQLDGVASNNKDLLILGATNMPWDIDAAMKRPGRFDRQVFVPPPDMMARAEMFRQKLIDVPIGKLDYDFLARKTPLASGADVDGIIDLAKDLVLDDVMQQGKERPIVQNDLLSAVKDFEPSTREWMKTAETIVKFGGGKKGYKDLAAYLRTVRL